MKRLVIGLSAILMAMSISPAALMSIGCAKSMSSTHKHIVVSPRPTPIVTEVNIPVQNFIPCVNAEIAAGDVLQQEEREIVATQMPQESAVLKLATDYEIELIARTIWGEAEGVKSRDEQAAVAWCILNRVDLKKKSIKNIVLAPEQFHCRTWDDEVPAYFTDLAQDVVRRWEREKAGEEEVGRVLPADYIYFIGDGERNHFSTTWRDENVKYWDWQMPSPYEMEE